MSRYNCGRAREKHSICLDLAEIMQGEVIVMLPAGLGKSVMLSMSSIVV